MIIHLHRHGDKIAISLEGQPTVYLPEKLAAQLTVALAAGVDDLIHHSFVESKFPTQTLETP